MATYAHLVLRNFIWRIEAIAPKCAIPGKDFEWYDDLTLDADQSAGMTRAFNVKWQGRTQALDVEDLTERWAVHRFRVEVAYSTQYQLQERQEIILQDAHDLIKTLRDDRYWVGYSSSASSTDVGLKDRHLDSDEIITESLTWYYRQHWMCHIKEVE